MPPRRRLDAVERHLTAAASPPPCDAAPAAAAPHPPIRLERQRNLSGDGVSAQGFGRVAARPQPHAFDPATETAAAVRYFEQEGFVVLAACFDAAELAHLNGFCERTQRERPESWGLVPGKRRVYQKAQGLIFSLPLLDHPELDSYARHPRSHRVISTLLGGADQVRISEFNFRETPVDGGHQAMNFHHDAVTQDRFTRKPYYPVDWVCAIHYLSDVDEGAPSFCVVPRSNRYRTLRAARDELGDEYRELPLYGPAGTCILYDTALFHTRLDGDGRRGRRTLHQYYARGGWLATETRYIRPPAPNLTDWNVWPQRLALAADPPTRRLFSHWNTAQGEWAASGFSDEVRRTMPKGYN